MNCYHFRSGRRRYRALEHCYAWVLCDWSEKEFCHWSPCRVVLYAVCRWALTHTSQHSTIGHPYRRYHCCCFACCTSPWTWASVQYHGYWSAKYFRTGAITFFFLRNLWFFLSTFHFYETPFKTCPLQRTRSGQWNMRGVVLRHRVSCVEDLVESSKLGRTIWMLFPVRDHCRYRYCIHIQLFARDWRQNTSRNRNAFHEEKR